MRSMIQLFVLMVWIFLMGYSLSGRQDEIESSINRLEAKVNQATELLRQGGQQGQEVMPDSTFVDISREVGELKGTIKQLTRSISDLRSQMQAVKSTPTATVPAMPDSTLIDINRELKGAMKKLLTRSIPDPDLQLIPDSPSSPSKQTKVSLSPSPKSLVYDEDGSVILCEKTGMASCRQVFDSYDAAFRSIMGNPYDTTILGDLVREYKWKHRRRHISLRYERGGLVGGPSMVEYHSR